MDEKKVREAIAKEKETIKTLEDAVVNGKTGSLRRWAKDTIENSTIIIEALEKQLPKKPIIKSEKEVPHTHNLGRLLRFHCPNCGKFIVGMYENDVERGGGISNRLKGCSTCLQSIDFSEYYIKRDIGNNKLNEDIEWSD